MSYDFHFLMFLVIDLRLRYTKALCFLDIPAGNRIPRTADEYLCMQLCGTSHLRNPEGCDFIAFKATNYHIREHEKTWLCLVFRTVRRGNPEKQGPPSARYLPSLQACDAGLSPLRSPPALRQSMPLPAFFCLYGGRHTIVPRPSYGLYHSRRTRVPRPPYIRLYAAMCQAMPDIEHQHTAAGFDNSPDISMPQPLFRHYYIVNEETASAMTGKRYLRQRRGSRNRQRHVFPGRRLVVRHMPEPISRYRRRAGACLNVNYRAMFRPVRIHCHAE